MTRKKEEKAQAKKLAAASGGEETMAQQPEEKKKEQSVKAVAEATGRWSRWRLGESWERWIDGWIRRFLFFGSFRCSGWLPCVIYGVAFLDLGFSAVLLGSGVFFPPLTL